MQIHKKNFLLLWFFYNTLSHFFILLSFTIHHIYLWCSAFISIDICSGGWWVPFAVAGMFVVVWWGMGNGGWELGDEGGPNTDYEPMIWALWSVCGHEGTRIREGLVSSAIEQQPQAVFLISNMRSFYSLYLCIRSLADQSLLFRSFCRLCTQDVKKEKKTYFFCF